MGFERFAPAKVNLFLHVGPVGADGYHPLVSLMVFADVGDTVRLRPAAEMAFRLQGPFAGALEAAPDNLVTRARDALIAGLPRPPEPFEISLDKRLPIAAGLGGGSADAAAALVLVAERLVAEGLAPTDAARQDAIARRLGADVPACLAARPVIGRGRGDDLSPAPPIPALHAALVNPMAASPTGAVYRAFDAAPPGPGADEPAWPEAFAAPSAVAAFLRQTRNDLEAPAIALQPLIGEVLDALAAAPQTLFARMSGSGATCFALTAGPGEARDLAAGIQAAHPTWWARACVLGDGGSPA